MKKTASRLLALVIWLNSISVSLYAQGDKEQNAIKAVVALETQSFNNVDYKTWSDTWWPTTYAYWSYSDTTYSSFVDGWQNIDKTFEEYFKTQKPSKGKITNDWKEVRVYGSGAYVRFIQKVDDGIDNDETSQVRVLEKRDGKWKIVCMNAVAKYPGK